MVERYKISSVYTGSVPAIKTKILFQSNIFIDKQRYLNHCCRPVTTDIAEEMQ